MPRERTYIMIKPDGVQRGIIGDIISRFEAKGFKMVAMKLCSPTKEHLEEHYKDLAGKKFFPGLIEYMRMGPVCCMVWEGDNVVKTGRVMLGATNPADSLPGTIRGDLCIHVGRNICHGSDSVESANHEIALWFSDAELNAYSDHSEAWVYEEVEKPAEAADATEGGAVKSGPSVSAGSVTVGKTVHAPFGPIPGADTTKNEYVTYSDDPAIGKPCPDLSTLDYVQGEPIKIGDGRVKIVFFWGKYLKWQCFPTMIGMSEINEEYGDVDIVGIAADKKRKDVERFLEKGECRADVPLAFDMDWKLKDAFRGLMQVGALAVPHAFLIDGQGNIVWRQAYSAGYQFATQGFLAQLNHLRAGEPLENHGPNPEPEEEFDEEVEAKDVFATQEVPDAIW